MNIESQKINDAIENMSYEELIDLKNNILEGNIQKTINDKIEEKREQTNKVCPVCHNTIDENSLKLEFGPKDLRRRAYFCAIDCLEYFINRIKKQ